MRDYHKELVIKTAIQEYENSIMFGFNRFRTPRAIKGMEDALYMCSPYNIDGTAELRRVINLAKRRYRTELLKAGYPNM